MLKVAVTPTLLLLHLRSFTSRLALLTYSNVTEVYTDLLEDEFVRVVDYAEAYLGASRTLPARLMSKQDCYGVGVFEFGVLPAVFTVAHKCRSPAVRRRALQILEQAQRREGLHDSQILADFARSIIALEASATHGKRFDAIKLDSMCPEVIPEAARFSDIVLAEDENTLTRTFVATRYMCSDSGRPSAIELIHYQLDQMHQHLGIFDRTVCPVKVQQPSWK